MIVKSKLPTRFGEFELRAYESDHIDFPHLALYTKNYASKKVSDVRIHSECMTGDVFMSSRCDCGEQLHYAMEWIQKNEGVIIYLRQEGRGIGLINKLKAYNLQDAGLNTCDANTKLGFREDGRNYTIAAEILQDLGVNEVRLLTNNPDKISELEKFSIRVADRLPIEIHPNSENESYLKTKKDLMGHMLNLV